MTGRTNVFRYVDKPEKVQVYGAEWDGTATNTDDSADSTDSNPPS